MSAYLNEEQLKNVLEQLLDKMEEKGIKIKDSKRDEIKDTIAQELRGEIKKEDIKDVNVQKKLIACITSLIMEKDKDFKFLIGNLKSDPTQKLDNKGLDNKLQAELNFLIKLTVALDPAITKTNKLTPAEFKQKILKETMKNQKNPPDPKELTQSEIEKQLDASIRNQYGGNDPRIDGEVEFIIQGPVFGNTGWTNITVANPLAVNKMQEDITYKPGPDYIGLEGIAKTDLIADGIVAGLDLDNIDRPTLRPPTGVGG